MSEEFNEQPLEIQNEETTEIEAIDEEPIKRKEPVKIPLSTFIMGCAACLIIGSVLARTFFPISSNSPLADKINLIDKLISENYIDADKMDKDKMNDTALWGYVAGLEDPYAAYFDGKSYTELQYSNAGGTHGIGITAVYYDEGGGIYITRVNPNSPAKNAGLLATDIITAVDGKAVTRESFSQDMDGIRGEKGTKVKLTIKRKNKSLDIEVTRDEFTVEAVYSRMIGDIGYIYIDTFNKITEVQFNENLEWVLSQKAKGIIFDLRGNTGGLVDVTNNMLNPLLGEGEIGYALYQKGERKRLGWSDKKSVDLPFAVLTDKNTASSAEYFASALRDSAKAKLIGTTTYGKAIMQTTYALGDGSALRVTVAKIFTASGTDYHKKGLKPDVEVSYTEEQQKNWFLLTDDDDPFIQAAMKSFEGN